MQTNESHLLETLTSSVGTQTSSGTFLISSYHKAYVIIVRVPATPSDPLHFFFTFQQVMEKEEGERKREKGRRTEKCRGLSHFPCGKCAAVSLG